MESTGWNKRPGGNKGVQTEVGAFTFMILDTVEPEQEPKKRSQNWI